MSKSWQEEGDLENQLAAGLNEMQILLHKPSKSEEDWMEIITGNQIAPAMRSNMFGPRSPKNPI